MSSPAKMTLSRYRAVLGDSILTQALWVIGFAVATALGARAEITHLPVPYTLQTLVVLLAGALLGPVNGALSQIVYLGAGISGVPVFAGGSVGLLVLAGPTGGYLMAFPVAAAVVGLLLERRRGIAREAAAMASGLFLIFALGTVQLYAFALHNFAAAVNAGFLIFSWWDLIKLCAAVMIYHEIAKRWGRIPAEQS